MKLFLGIAGIVVVNFLIGGAPARAQGFPDGPGKQIVQEACTVCHGSDLIANVRRSKADWTDTVQDMVSRGAPLKEGEREIVIEYLAANFSPDKAQRMRAPEPQQNPNRPDKKKPPVLNAAARSKLFVASR